MFGVGPDHCRGCEFQRKTCGRECPTEKHAPLTLDGAIVWDVGSACLRAVDGARVIDLAAALALALARGASPAAAAELLAEMQLGVAQGHRDKINGGT